MELGYRGYTLQTSPAPSLEREAELETVQFLSKLRQDFQNPRNHSRNLVALHLRNLTSGGQPALTDFALPCQTVLANASHQSAGARIHVRVANQDSEP